MSEQPETAPQSEIVVTMRAPDGRVFEHRYHRPKGTDLEVEEFMWTDGNYSCDCNMSLFIGRDHGVWLGTPERGLDEGDGKYSLPCGFTIDLLRITCDGVAFYEDE